MNSFKYVGYAVALVAICECISFIMTHILVTRFNKHVIWAKLVSVTGVFGFCILLLCLATSAHAFGSITDVAECTLAANKRLPAGPALRKAEEECYRILPPKIAGRAYKDRHPDEGLVVIEGRQNSLGAARGRGATTTIEPWRSPLPALRYPYPYGPPPQYQSDTVQITAPR